MKAANENGDAKQRRERKAYREEMAYRKRSENKAA